MKNFKTIVFILILILVGVLLTSLIINRELVNNEVIPEISQEDAEMYELKIFEAPSTRVPIEDPKDTLKDIEVVTQSELVQSSDYQANISPMDVYQFETSNFEGLVSVETSPGYYSLVESPENLVLLPEKGMIWGVYDPNQEYSGYGSIDMEQIYVNWLELPGLTYSKVSEVLNQNRVPFVSVEPYPWEGHEFNPVWIAKGAYDPHIVGHCSSLNIPDQKILVRFAHEMDLSEQHGIFPWIGQNSDDMVLAFQHFATLCREVAPNVEVVWSPAGHTNLHQYWPGDQYVDLIALTSLSNQLINGRETAEGAFEDLFGGRYALVSGYEKPVIIAEFGAAGTTEYVQTYLSEAFNSFNNYPLLEGVILFNILQTDDAWGEGVNPDFRVSPDVYPPGR